MRQYHQEMVAAAEEKNIWIVGGGDLAGQFYDNQLLDEIIVSIASVTLGKGAPLGNVGFILLKIKNGVTTIYSYPIEM